MNRNVGALFVPLLAIALLGVIAFQTVGALKDSGAWRSRARRFVANVPGPQDAFTPIATMLENPPAPLPTSLRDPFKTGTTSSGVSAHNGRTQRQRTPEPPPRPVVTAIVWDSDPRAIVRWQGRDWTVHSGALFDEFQVVAITRTQVTLSRGGETLILQRKSQGD